MTGCCRVRAAVFDIGGVLVDVDYRYLYRKLLGTEAEVEEFLTTICTQEWHSLHDLGLPLSEGVASRAAEFPEHAALIEAFHLRFPEVWGGPIETAVTVLGELVRRGVPTYGLTNWPAEMFPLARARFEFLDWFDGVVVSGEEGVTKPDPRIFDILCQRFSLRPADCVFIDDNEVNVAAAQHMGLRAVHFTSGEQLRAELCTLGLLGPPAEELV